MLFGVFLALVGFKSLFRFGQRKRQECRTPDQIWAHAHKPCAEACAAVRLVKLFTLWSNRTKSAWRWKPSATCEGMPTGKLCQGSQNGQAKKSSKWCEMTCVHIILYIYIPLRTPICRLKKNWDHTWRIIPFTTHKNWPGRFLQIYVISLSQCI